VKVKVYGEGDGGGDGDEGFPVADWRMSGVLCVFFAQIFFEKE
jgi:hypothetical protein